MKRALSFVLSLALVLSGLCISNANKVQANTTNKEVVSIKEEISKFNTDKEITVLPLTLSNAMTGFWDKDKDYSEKAGSSGGYVAFKADSCGSALDQYNLSFSAKSATIKAVASNVERDGVLTLPSKINVYRIDSGGKQLGKDADGKQIYKRFQVINPKTGETEVVESKYDYKMFRETYTVDELDGCLEGTSVFSNNNITVVLPDSVLKVGDLANGNPKLGRVYGKGITDIGDSTFKSCTNMSDVYFPNCKVLGNRAFYGCVSLGKQGDKLTNIEFPSVHSVGNGAFQGCTSLVKVDLGTTLQTLGDSAFEGCVSIEDIDLTGGTASGGQGTNTISTIPNKCFSGCTNLKNIKITERLVNIGSNSFYQCDMRDFKFENTKLQTIGSNAFSGCLNLSYASLPDTVTEVGNGAFSNCYNLRYLYSINPNIKDNVVSELYTFLEKGVKDIKGGIVAKDDSYLDINSRQIYAGGTIKIVDDMNDIDIDSIVVKKNGTTYLASKDLTEYLDVRTVPNGLRGYKFKIPQGVDGHGSYEITFSDVAGNIRTVNFDYKMDVEDVTPPEIKVEGETLADDIYKAGSKVICSDDLGIDKITLNDEPVENDVIELKEDGEYTVEVTDSNGNKVTKTIVIDAQAPIIDGIKYSVTAKPFKFTVSDSNIYSVLLNDKDITEEAADGYQVNVSNKYILRATDKAGNVSEKTFIYSANGATIKGVTNGVIYNNNITLTWDSFAEIESAKLKAGDNPEIDITSGYVCSEDNDYTLKVTDELGKTVTVKFGIDKTAPTIREIKNGGYYHERVSLKVDDNSKYTISENGREVSNSFSDERTYNLVVTDEAGNQTKIKFTIDNTAPKMSIADKGSVKKGKVIKFQDKSGVDTTKLYYRSSKSGSWKSYKTLNGSQSFKPTKNGFYKAVIKDKSGLSSTNYFTVDSSKPTVNVKNGKTYKSGKTLKFKDSLSGIKTAKLNGMRISSGYRLNSTGKQTLTVVDNAGNKKTVKFRVK